MKELSIEEKARRYDEAIKIANEYFNSPRTCVDIDVFPELFPELVESEDERIRNAIINVFATHKYYEIFFGASVEDILAWLEKQGEQKPTTIQIGRNYKCIASPRYTCFKTGFVYKPCDEFLCGLMNFCSDCFEPIEGEQKPTDKVDALMSLDEAIEHCKKRSCGNNACALEHKQLEKWLTELKELQEQQKPVETVEPKFKVGDWVINTITKEVEQILELTGSEYLCSGYLIVSYSEQHLLKSWTIQDAKDGDVLATKKGNPFIYDKNRYNNGLAYYYAGLDVNKELTLKSPHHMLGHFGELCSVFPATEEQYDLLFSKMREAGYEWDADNKKLKKIDEELTDFEKSLKHIMLETLECGDTHNLKADADMLLRLAQNYGWSEEDENMLDRAIYMMEQLDMTESWDDVYNWLKSLPERLS